MLCLPNRRLPLHPLNIPACVPFTTALIQIENNTSGEQERTKDCDFNRCKFLA